VSRARIELSRYISVAALARSVTRFGRTPHLVVAAVLAGCMLVTVQAGGAKADPCGAGGNPVACENTLQGTPQSVWDVGAGEGTTIQGFADPFSVNLGGTINFKIESPASSYAIDIYRMGYYGGDGARLITSLTPNISISRNQPTCHTNTATGLVDCSNWGVSASWTVPTNLVSGVYFAHISRTDGTSDENQIPFVVRSDSSHSDILFQTDDETWQAYNDWGGYSLYAGNAADTTNRFTSLDSGRAEQVSYDRPFATRFDTPNGQDFFFYAEFPMIQFLEENGYNVSYIDQGAVAGSNGAALIEQHKVLLKSGHDEYWTASEVANVTAARNAGVNMAFFTGNEVYWKTRFAPDAAGEANRTLITYKETLDSAQTDPSDPPTWTGAWYDPRFSPPADGGRPQNALTGQLWTVNAGTSAITVPSQYAALRFWRNTAVASLQPGQTATLANETLGYEWDQDVDNGFRPAGEFGLSSTTMTAPSVVTDYQEDLAAETLTHHLTLYRASSGALVFGAGTVQWAWGLNSIHDGDQPATSTTMQQATVNLLADMGNVQPLTLMSGLVPAKESTDTTPPTSTITSPTPGTSIANGSTVTITGTATDSGGGVVAGVEVSTDGGSTWHPVTTMSAAATTVTWSYTWSATGLGNVTIESRATDDSGNIETPSAGVTVTANCPCGLYGQNYTPSVTAENDSTAVELGVKFTSAVSGWVAGIRFYKGPGNNGTHTGTLWTSTGTQLATGTFTNETASGWQTLQFTNPVAITANTEYVAGYYAPDGHYSYDVQQFYPGTTGSPYLPPLDSAPLAAIRATATTTNGVFNAGGPGFPTSTFNDSGYGVDVIFDNIQPPGLPPAITSAMPASGATSVPVGGQVSITFNQQIQPGSATLSITGPGASAVQGSTSLDSTGTVLTFTPASALAASTSYTVSVGGATSVSNSVMTPVTWQFTTSGTATCPCTLFASNAVPNVASANDSTPVTLGVQFTTDTNGWIMGVRFYKGSGNTGTHIGSLWTAAGTLLTQGTFTNETSSGWQTLGFSNPVVVTAGTTYVAGYYAPNGKYAADPGYFSNGNIDNSPLHAQSASGLGGNGVYSLGNSFPDNTYNGMNYWVDPIFGSTPPTTNVPPQVSISSPASAQTNVPVTSNVSFTFNQAVQGSSVGFTLTGPGGASVAGSTSYNASTATGTFTPSTSLTSDTTYTATVSKATGTNGLAMTAAYSWTFTTAELTIWPVSAQPAIASASDPNPVNVGVKFTTAANGWITGIRFYKGPSNSGTHTGDLWDSSGNLLGQVTFTNETATGWQQANFATPIAVTAGTTYIASYYAPNGGYSVTSGDLASGVSNPPLVTE
jgi:methionine-rich copper-binding protein CopC